MSYEQEKQVAVEASLAAAQLCEQVRAQIVPEAMEKQDRSPVTIADFGSQAVICRALATACPQDSVVGEEDATTLRQPEMADALAQVTQYVQAVAPGVTPEEVTSWIDHGNGEVRQRYWTLDPIDGTKGFLRGDQYAIALALVEAGEVKVGVLACPSLSVDLPQFPQAKGLLFVAVRGEGATVVPSKGDNPHSIQVVSPDDQANLRFVESVESGHSNQARQAAIAEQVGITNPSLRIDSQAKYGAVASGQAALYLRLPSPKTPEYQENIWDHAAGAIIVEEAGGRVTDMYGKPLDFSLGSKLINNQGVIVSNGSIHDTVLAALKEQVKS